MGVIVTSSGQQPNQWIIYQSKKVSKGNVNIVHDEQIWRDHIRTETSTLKVWESKWGFTEDMYKEMYNQEEPAVTTEASKGKNKFPETTQKTYGWKKPNPLYAALSASDKPKTSIHQRLKWPVDGCY